LQSTNPAFSQSFAQNFDYAGTRSNTMTVQGTAMKAFVLLAIMMTTAGYSWTRVAEGSMSIGLAVGSGIGAFVLAMITIFRPTASPYTSPLYAGLQGICLGAISRIFEARFPGIVVQAVALTGGVTFLMLFIYATRLIRVTGQLTAAIVSATGAIFLVYMASWIMSMFGTRIPYIHDSGPIGIGFGLFVVGLAAFNLLLDFDLIEQGSNQGWAKSMEWYGAFALMITLVWMYRQILDLLRKINGRD